MQSMREDVLEKWAEAAISGIPSGKLDDYGGGRNVWVRLIENSIRRDRQGNAG
jgi:hypothetical protein